MKLGEITVGDLSEVAAVVAADGSESGARVAALIAEVTRQSDGYTDCLSTLSTALLTVAIIAARGEAEKAVEATVAALRSSKTSDLTSMAMVISSLHEVLAVRRRAH